MFSVVIPLYNKKLFIKDTIESILNQEYQDFEIIVIDDGSDDGSVEIIESIKDDRIKLVQQINQGVSTARNCGIREAKYKWIAFVDGDDLWKSNHLKEILKMIERFPNEKVYVTSFGYSDDRYIFRHSRETSIFKVVNYFKEALKEPIVWTSNVVIDKGCFKKVGLFNRKISRGEDLDMWARLASEYSIIKSSQITAIYNVTDQDSLTKSKSVYGKSILSIINLRGKRDWERYYFKNILISRIKLDIKTLGFKDSFKILIKHNFQLLI